MSFITWSSVYFILCGISLVQCVLTPALPCPSGCTTCETLPGTSYVIRAVCSGVPPSNLPMSIRELRVKNVVFPGVLTPDSFENKTDLTLLEVTNSTGCQVIWDEAFSVCSKLNNLIIEKTDLLGVSEKTFWGLVGLETLSLKHNNLMNIQKAFLVLKKLTHLDLDSNQLTAITSDMFQGLTNLYELRLAGNKIAKIDPDSFQDLKSLYQLDLGDNRITMLERGLFQGLSNLRKLNVKNNKISQIKSSAFHGTMLQQIDLASNSFTKFPLNAFANLTHVPNRLSFANNLITTVEDYNFKGLAVQVLDLGYNKISSVSAKAFDDCSILMVELDFNNIATLPEQIEPFWEKARAITIDGNHWNCDCDLLWMVRFITKSSPRKYKARATAPMPACQGGAKYANQPFNIAEPALEAECITTTMTESTTEIETSTSEPITESSTITTTDLETTEFISTTTTEPMTTTARPLTTTSTRKPTEPETTVTMTTAMMAENDNPLYPGLWIGLAVLAGVLMSGIVLWYFFIKRPKASKIGPQDKESRFPDMVSPTMIQVQAPVSTTMPTFSSSKNKLAEVLDNEANQNLSLHNGRTLKTTSIA